MKEKFKEKLMNELDIIKSIDHPHIYTIYDFYEDAENFYIISEYLKGGEFFDYLEKKGSISEKEAFAVIKILISAINYLHKKGIIYRDIKPENIVFAEKDKLETIKLIDFGTAERIAKD